MKWNLNWNTWAFLAVGEGARWAIAKPREVVLVTAELLRLSLWFELAEALVNDGPDHVVVLHLGYKNSVNKETRTALRTTHHTDTRKKSDFPRCFCVDVCEFCSWKEWREFTKSEWADWWGRKGNYEWWKSIMVVSDQLGSCQIFILYYIRSLYYLNYKIGQTGVS